MLRVNKVHLKREVEFVCVNREEHVKYIYDLFSRRLTDG